MKNSPVFHLNSSQGEVGVNKKTKVQAFLIQLGGILANSDCEGKILFPPCQRQGTALHKALGHGVQKAYVL